MTAARLTASPASQRSSDRTHPVSAKNADALGLFDLFGNAAEWVSTGAAGDDTSVTRGGSFRDAPDAIAAGARAVQDESWNERDPQLPKSRGGSRMDRS
jgi:formylglycine-generating enzyme required for sulfatase activity